MPSAFADRFEAVAMPMLEQQFSVSVVLRVGSRQTDAFIAIGGDRQYSSIEFETGVPVKIASRDWLLPVASCVVNGTPVTPRAGCRIIEGAEEFEIVPIDSRPAVELVEGGYRYMCHSQRITT